MWIIFLILLIGCSIGSTVCWVFTLVKMFGDAGTGTGIFGIICGIYAFIWGWQNHHSYPGHEKIMKIWSACFVGSIVGNVAMQATMTM